MSIAQNNVNTYVLKDFPSPQKREEMEITEFLKLPNFPLNREVEKRALTTTMLLTDPYYKHNEVDVCIYKGDTTQKPAFFKKDQKYLLNGNTRQYIWQKYMNGNLVNKHITSIPIPSKVIVNYYEFDDAYHAYRVYNSIDSSDSVETTPQKLTGAFRAINILSTLKNKKFKTGGVKSALSYACPYGKNLQIRVAGISDLIDQTSAMKDVIVAMDKLDLPGHGAFKYQLMTGIAMLAGKRMGVDNQKWISIVEKLGDQTEDSLWELSTDPDVKDPIYYLLKAKDENPLGEDFKDALPYKTGAYYDRNLCLDFMSYCWRKIVDGEDIKTPPTKAQVVNSYARFIQDTWEDPELDG